MKTKQTNLITFFVSIILLTLITCQKTEGFDEEFIGAGNEIISKNKEIKKSIVERSTREWFVDVRMRNLKLGFKEAFNSILNDRNFVAGDIIKLGAGPYIVDGDFSINKTVTIVGNHKYGTPIYQRTGSKNNPNSSLFIVCNAEKIKFKNLTINAGGKSSKAVHANNQSIEFYNVKFLDAKWAVFSNKNIGGLKILHCFFTKTITFRGIEMNRVWSKAQVESMRQIEIKHTIFEGKKPSTGKEKFAISIDCGNEPANNNSVVTNMNNMVIEKCTFKDDFAGGIALAQVANVIINDNVFEAGNEQKQNAIHIEDTTSGIDIKNNHFYCNTSSSGKPLIFIGSSERGIFADGSKKINILGNILAGKAGVSSQGKCVRILESERSENIYIARNKMCKMSVFNAPKISFFNENKQINIPHSGSNKNDCVSYQIRNFDNSVTKYPR